MIGLIYIDSYHLADYQESQNAMRTKGPLENKLTPPIRKEKPRFHYASPQ
jgi:hypothetical protein